MPAINLDQFENMRLAEAAEILGRSLPAAKAWLQQRGFRCPGMVVTRPRLAGEVQDEINRRLDAAPPASPCFNCGARGFCRHRPAPSNIYHQGARQ